jgi:hypothetical protein
MADGPRNSPLERGCSGEGCSGSRALLRDWPPGTLARSRSPDLSLCGGPGKGPDTRIRYKRSTDWSGTITVTSGIRTGDAALWGARESRPLRITDYGTIRAATTDVRD